MKRARSDDDSGSHSSSKRRKLLQVTLNRIVVDHEEEGTSWKWSLGGMRGKAAGQQENLKLSVKTQVKSEGSEGKRRSSRRISLALNEKNTTQSNRSPSPVKSVSKKKAKQINKSPSSVKPVTKKKGAQSDRLPPPVTVVSEEIDEGLPVKPKTEDESDDEDGIEKRRLKNLEDNARFLASIGMPPELKLQKRRVKIRIKEKSITRPPRREKSLRLQNIDPDGDTVAPTKTSIDTYVEPDRPRKPSGPIAMADYTWRTEDGDVTTMTELMYRLSEEKTTEPVLSTASQQEFLKKMDSLRMRDFVKATKDQIFSVAFHPSTTKLLAVVGDKWGGLAFWDMVRGQEGMATFVPHSRPVNHIVCPRHDPSRVYSASYDGTLRATVLEHSQFEEVYVTDEDDDIRLTRFDLLSPSSLIVAQGDGNVAVVDTRTTSTSAESLYPVHYRLVKCVNVHPTQKHYFLTATNNGVVNLWDIRKISKNRPECVTNLPHSKSVDAAHFSPVNGHRILTTCYDNLLTVYDSSNLSQITKLRTIKHNNQTGRWLTNFRAYWHPQREDLFVVGSMNHPRQIELYSTDGVIVKTFTGLTSVSSLNAFHPTLDALVGANSSGRVVSYF